MKKVTKFFMAALLAGMCSFGNAQDYLKSPKANEIVLGTVSDGRSSHVDCIDGWYERLLAIAKDEYSGKTIDIRNIETGYIRNVFSDCTGYYGPATGKVVWIMSKEVIREYLSQAFYKVMRNVHDGSRFAIDQLSVPFAMDREFFKDELIDMLLDEGYKVVAKEYLEKLYEELQAQQSGIYNDRTTVQENNFSAVGYYLNIKLTVTSLRVQVVNVSTGEYEGNATVNF